MRDITSWEIVMAMRSVVDRAIDALDNETRWEMNMMKIPVVDRVINYT